MNKKELHRLKRRDLLEMLLELSKENERLRTVNGKLEEELQKRIITLLKADSLGEAVLQLNGVFEAAQKACDQYTYNTQMRCKQMEENTKIRCDQMLREAMGQVEQYEKENHE